MNLRPTKRALLAAVVPVVLCGTGLAANSWGRAAMFNGIGAGLNLPSTLAGEADTEPELALQYRYGFIYIVSGFMMLEAGYRPESGDFSHKLGLQAMFLLWGLEAGYAGVHAPARDEYSPGMYLGICSVLPFEDQLAAFVSLGANIYFDSRDNEFYLSLSMFFNFAE